MISCLFLAFNKANSVFSKATQNENILLQEFLESIEQEHVVIKRPAEEIDDIRSAIEEMVHNILIKMGEEDPRFKDINQDLLKVGSFYGKTKIKEPDEFDYLVVLDKLNPDEVTLKEDCETHPGFRHIIVKEHCKFYEKWRDVLDKGNAIINMGRDKVKIVEEIGDWHREEFPMQTIAGPGFIIFAAGFRSLFSLCLHECFQKVKKETGAIEKHTGILDLSTYSKKFTTSGSEYTFDQKRVEIQLHGPATNICVHWKSSGKTDTLEINVDISPAFRATDIKAYLMMEHFLHNKFRQAVLQHGSFLVIPTSLKCNNGGLCFNIAHTETEQQLVKCLSETHRRCYKVLKYLMNGEASGVKNKITEPHHVHAFRRLRREFGTQACQFLSSFALKSLIFQHCIWCQNGSGLGLCVLQLLKRIRELLESTQPRSSVHLEEMADEVLKDNYETFKTIDVKNVFDKRQLITAQKLNNDVIVKPSIKALDDLIGLLTQVS